MRGCQHFRRSIWHSGLMKPIEPRYAGPQLAGFEVGQQKLVVNWRRKSSSGLPLLSYRKLSPILRPSKRRSELGVDTQLRKIGRAILNALISTARRAWMKALRRL